MAVLVAYASRHASTWGVAERIAARLRGLRHERLAARAAAAPDGGFRPRWEIDDWPETIASQLGGALPALAPEVAKR